MVLSRNIFMVLSVGILLIPPAHAETSANEIDDLLSLSIEELLDVPITSTAYFEEDWLHAGSTVTVIDEKDWQQRGARRTQDALLNQPSLAISSNFLGQFSTRIRGFSLSTARGIETLWDGVPISSFNLGTADVDRTNIQLNTLNSIEVIRGPGSAFYGAGAFFGAISLQAFESDEDLISTSISAATNGYYNTSAKLSRALDSNNRMNIAVSTNGQPNQNLQYDYTDTATGLRATNERDYKYNSYTLVAKLNSSPEKEWSYKAGLYYDYNDQNRFHSEGINTATSDISDNRSDMAMGQFSITRRLDAGSSLEAQAYHWQQVHDFSFTQPQLGGINADIHGKETRSAVKLIYRNDNLFANTRSSMAFSYRRDKINEARRVISNTAGNILVDANLPIAGVDRTITSFLLDNATSFMDDRLTLRYGLRFDSYSDFGNQTTPRLGIIYALNPNEVVKLLYGNAFRAPTAIEVGGTPFIKGRPDIKPETIDTYELVYMRQTSNSKLELVAFYSRWEDAILSLDTSGNNIPDTFGNVGDNQSEGLEASYEIYSGNWRHTINASYVKSENTSTNQDYVAFPKYIVNIGTGYRFDQKLSLYVNNRLQFKSQNGPGQNNRSTTSLPTYWRTDVNLTRKYSKKINLFANIRNIFNRDNYISSLGDLEGGLQDEEISLEVGLRYSD
ncbi:MAG TPA: hypothetical protein ENI64_02415 [Gammaproteobacteria bacterium]|nr:hypothetical protein [Gammaproteobacteria bacterium]